MMQPQNTKTSPSEDADKHLSNAGRWIVANIRQRIGWPDETMLVEFRQHTLALMPEDMPKYPAVAFLKPPDLSDHDARTLIQHFLSSLAWAEGRAINIEGWSGGGRPYRLSHAGFGQICRPRFQVRYLPDPQDRRARLALALYREGIGLDHVPYAFLSLYKIINLIRPKGPDQIAWISGHLSQIWDREAIRRIATIRAHQEDTARYLYVSGRCAVAHAGTDPTIDPENPEDTNRLRLDLPVIRNLAEIAIETEFQIQTPHTVWSEHKYELGGFRRILGSDIVEEMKSAGASFPPKIFTIPRLTIRLWNQGKYVPFSDMDVCVAQTNNGLIVLQCTSPSKRISVLLGLDFTNERLIFDPIHGVSLQDDGTPEAAEEAAEVQRFLAQYFANGQLEVWAEHDDLLSRCDVFIPFNIDLDATISNFRFAEGKCLETATNRRSTR